MQPDFNLKLWEVEKKYLTGTPLTSDDIQVAITGLNSKLLDERVIACEALLRNPNPSASAEKVIAVVRELCQTSLQSNGDCNPALVLVVLLLPKETIMREAVFQEFAFSAAQASDIGCRTNSMLLLEYLARLGISGATGSLRDALDDEEEIVRKNAGFFLNRLGEHSN